MFFLLSLLPPLSLALHFPFFVISSSCFIFIFGVGVVGATAEERGMGKSEVRGWGGAARYVFSSPRLSFLLSSSLPDFQMCFLLLSCAPKFLAVRICPPRMYREMPPETPKPGVRAMDSRPYVSASIF